MTHPPPQPPAAAAGASPAQRYMGEPVALATLANGAVTHAGSQAQLNRSMYREPTVDRVAPGVTVFGGDAWLNLALIEGDEGLIVYDSGEVLDDGERFLRQIRTISDKPIVAIVYSHSHYVHGSTALVGRGDGVAVIGHPRLNDNLAAGATGTVHAETAPIQVSRLMQQFTHFVAGEGPDASAGAEIRFGRSGMLPVNTPVQDGQEMTIAGVRMQCFTRHGSDTDDCLTLWLPDRGVALNNILWPFVPNIYTLRGAKYRDPRDWRDALQVILDLKPRVLVNTHARSIVGEAACADALEHVIDALNLILDQTLRGILRGLGPEDLRAFVRLPPALAGHPNLAEIYGEVSHFGPYLDQHALGWFDGDAASINPLPPAEQARRLVQAMGGPARVLEQARAALRQQESAWAAQLLQYLLRLDPLDPQARAAQAEAFTQMGRVTPAHTVRNWYMSQARALRGEIDIPLRVFPGSRQLGLMAPAQTMEQFRVRIDPAAAGDTNRWLVLAFTDGGARHGWHIRRGTARFVADLPATLPADTVELRSATEAWHRLFTCRIGPEEFLQACTCTAGSPGDARHLLGLFDHYPPADNHLIPPA